MQKLKAIITLIRLPNVIFIFLTQLLVYLYLIKPLLNTFLAQHALLIFINISLSTALIAMAGYMINDYFDIKIDRINKPHNVTLDVYFTSKKIILWHILLNVFAVVLAGYICKTIVGTKYIAIQLMCILLLLTYSSTFKRKLFIGNLIIAFLNSFSIISIAIYLLRFEAIQLNTPYHKLIWMYVYFAFLITLIREIVKDIEDVKGDTISQCKTIPLVFGINMTKQIVYLLSFILIIVLLYYIFRIYVSLPLLSIYLTVFIFCPLLYVLYVLKNANSSSEFHTVSTFTKSITFLGILSILLI